MSMEEYLDEVDYWDTKEKERYEEIKSFIENDIQISFDDIKFLIQIIDEKEIFDNLCEN